MLELRCVCENCKTPLPPDSTNAMICSFECTFCRECVATILDNICPNCGGSFCQRPTRPQFDFVHNERFNLPDRKLIYKPVNSSIHAALINKIRSQG